MLPRLSGGSALASICQQRQQRLSVPRSSDMGPAAVALLMPKPWVIGTLVRQLWSVAGPSDRPNVSQLLVQPFINYNMAEGWYLVSSPIITTNWEASSGNKWTLPLGGGIGKIFRVGEQPMNASLQAFDYVQSLAGGPRWA